MKRKKKNIICYIIVIIVIIILILSIFIVPVSRNNKYKNDIYSNTDIKNISYYNKSNNYYIVKDDKYVYVFDLNYDKVYSRDISELSASKLDIVYRRSNIYYEDKVRDKNKLTYKYYDVSTLEEVFDIDVGGI